MLTLQEKKEIIEKYRRDEKDTGSTEVQIALLTADINKLTEHFKIHIKDNHGRRGLLMKVNQRRRLLRYLAATKPDSYRELINSLGLRK